MTCRIRFARRRKTTVYQRRENRHRPGGGLPITNPGGDSHAVLVQVYLRRSLMVPVPLTHDQPSRYEPVEEWPWLDQGILIASRSRQVCLTCHFFRHHPGPNCIPLLSCHLHQGLIAHGEHITHCCPGWTAETHRSRGWAPEAS